MREAVSGEARVHRLTHDALLQRNVILNLAGWVLPAIAALVSIPLLAKGLGAARFGLVALTWATVGVFSLFDFGLGRALTRVVASRLAHGDDDAIPDLVWTASWALLALTGVLAIAGMALAPLIVDRLLDVPPAIRNEAVGVVLLLALSAPALAHGVALRGVLEAAQRFATINWLRVPLGVITYAGPLVALALGSDARIAVGVIVFGRIAYWLAHFLVLEQVHHGLRRPTRWNPAAWKELLSVCGWITVSSVVSPVIVNADRAIVAATLPIAASGWYGTAAEVATKQWLFTAALQPVFFSAIAAAIFAAPARASELMERATKLTMLVLLPAAAILAAFGEPLLRIWMRGAYHPEVVPVLRWLALAVYANALAQVPYSMLQAGVSARGAALLHLVELPVYLGVLVALAHAYGLRGVAIAWFLRMTLDGAGMWAILARQLPAARAPMWRLARLAIPCAIVLAGAALYGAYHS